MAALKDVVILNSYCDEKPIEDTAALGTLVPTCTCRIQCQLSL
jgi:hypothetical protein